MDRNPTISYRNLGLDHRRFAVTCVGIGGATVMHSADALLFEVDRLAPDIIFIHLEENDLRRTNPYLISSHLRQFISDLSHIARVVCVGQLLNFPRNEDVIGHTVYINNILRNAYTRNGDIRYWQHRGGFWNTERTVFCDDRIHLNEHGLGRYWHSVRHAILKAIRQLTKS